MPDGLPPAYGAAAAPGTGGGPVGGWVESYGAKPLPGVLRQRRALSAVAHPAIHGSWSRPQPVLETIMGKYLLAWLLGVPGIVLVLVYLFFH